MVEKEMRTESRPFVSGICADLKVVEIPDDATDWEIEEWDGLETVIYVLNGKLWRVNLYF